MWEAINAYVDGELSPEEAEAMAERAAQDPELRARIATLSRLKSATAQALHERRPARAARSSRLVWGALGVVTALSLTVMGPMTGSFTFGDGERPVELYRSWLAGTEPAGVPVSSHVEVAAWHGAPPDLGAAHLELVRAIPDERSGRGFLLGYQGPHGCRVGLWIGRSADMPRQGADRRENGIRIVGWEVDETGFLLLTHGMDDARLAALSDALERLTHRADPGQVRIALGQSAERGAPCAG